MPPVAKPWFRMYSSILTNRKVHNLRGNEVLGWLKLLAIANLQTPRGTLPPLEDIAFQLRLSIKAADTLLNALADEGLVEEREDKVLVMHDWNEWQAERDVNRERRDVTGANAEESSRFNHAIVTDSSRVRHARVEREKEKEEEREREGEKEARDAPSLPFVFAYAGRHQQRTGGKPPSPIQHSELVSLEREHGSELCFQAAEARGWDKPASYLRGWINDHGTESKPESREEAIIRLSRGTGGGVPEEAGHTDGVANGVSGLDRRRAAIARLGRGGQA